MGGLRATARPDSLWVDVCPSEPGPAFEYAFNHQVVVSRALDPKFALLLSGGVRLGSSVGAEQHLVEETVNLFENRYEVFAVDESCVELVRLKLEAELLGFLLDHDEV